MLDLKARAATLPNIFVLKENDCNLDERQGVRDRQPGRAEAWSRRGDNEHCSTSTTRRRPICPRPAPRCRGRHREARRTATRPPEVHLAAQRGPALLVPPLGRSAAGRAARSATARRRQDPETGEIISAAAYIYGAALDIYAKFAVDSVRLANSQLSTDDLLSGKTISDVLRGERRRPARARGRADDRRRQQPGPGARSGRSGRRVTTAA